MLMNCVLIEVLSFLWVVLATVTAVLAVDCVYTLMDERRWRY